MSAALRFGFEGVLITMGCGNDSWQRFDGRESFVIALPRGSETATFARATPDVFVAP